MNTKPYDTHMNTQKDLAQWATLYRGLGNPNRLRILKLLNKTDKLSVSELAEELGISLKNTSRNLAILNNLDLVKFQGRKDRVYYSLNKDTTKNVKTVLKVTFD